MYLQCLVVLVHDVEAVGVRVRQNSYDHNHRRNN